MWYVYFLELTNGDIYVGSTDDLRRAPSAAAQRRVADREGFEPSERLSTVHTLSRRAPSATRPPVHGARIYRICGAKQTDGWLTRPRARRAEHRKPGKAHLSIYDDAGTT